MEVAIYLQVGASQSDLEECQNMLLVGGGVR